MNLWTPIKGYDNRCTTWAYYPLLKGVPNLADVEIWNPHHSMDALFPKQPTYTISFWQTEALHRDMHCAGPTTGAVVTYMAILLKAEVFIAGFDFFKEGWHYDDPLARDADVCHNMPLEQMWFTRQIEKGLVKHLI